MRSCYTLLTLLHCSIRSAMALAILADFAMPGLLVILSHLVVLSEQRHRSITIELCGTLASQCSAAHLCGKVLSLGLEIIWNLWRLLSWEVTRNLDVLHSSFSLPCRGLGKLNCLALCLQDLLVLFV